MTAPAAVAAPSAEVRRAELRARRATWTSPRGRKPTHATAADPWAKDWLKSNTAGFGPYRLIRNIPGQEMELTRNPNYQPRPAVGRILIKIIPDSATRLALLKRGEVDFAMRLREREYQEVAKDANLQVVRHAANFIPYFGPVQTNPIMANVKVRQALAYAVPYDEIR